MRVYASGRDSRSYHAIAGVRVSEVRVLKVRSSSSTITFCELGTLEQLLGKKEKREAACPEGRPSFGTEAK